MDLYDLFDNIKAMNCVDQVKYSLNTLMIYQNNLIESQDN